MIYESNNLNFKMKDLNNSKNLCSILCTLMLAWGKAKKANFCGNHTDWLRNNPNISSERDPYRGEHGAYILNNDCPRS